MLHHWDGTGAAKAGGVWRGQRRGTAQISRNCLRTGWFWPAGRCGRPSSGACRAGRCRRTRRGLSPSFVGAGSYYRDGCCRALGRLSRAAGPLGAADFISHGHGFRRRLWHARPAAAARRNRHCAFGTCLGSHGAARRESTIVDRRASRRLICDLPWLCAWKGIARSRAAPRLFFGIRRRDRPPPSHRHRHRLFDPMAGRLHRGPCGRRHSLPRQALAISSAFFEDEAL